MNSFVSLLSATHTRIEAIENVVWPPTNTQIESTMQPVRLTFSPKIIKYFRYYLQKSKDPDLWRALFSNKAQAKIWVNPSITGLRGQTEVFIQRFITDGEKSNGFACKLTVFQAQIGPFRMALKFRQKTFYEGASETMAEIEGNNAMITEQNRSIRNLFPRMYCCIALVTPEELHREAIGTEYLDEIPRELLLTRPMLLAMCYDRLSELHQRGFSHGDPHLGNFMLDSDGRVRLIDQDEIQKLPKDPTLSKYIKILDYIELLFWFNPLCDPFPHLKDDQKQDTSWYRCAYQASYDKHRIFLTPYGFLAHKNGNHQDSQWAEQVIRDLKDIRTQVKGKTYWEYLESINNIDIDSIFFKIFNYDDTRRKICNFIDGRIRDFYKLIREALELKQNL